MLYLSARERQFVPPAYFCVSNVRSVQKWKGKERMKLVEDMFKDEGIAVVWRDDDGSGLFRAESEMYV